MNQLMRKGDISKFDKADVLRVLYNSARPQGMGLLHYDPNPMTKEEAMALVNNEYLYFDYIYS